MSCATGRGNGERPRGNARGELAMLEIMMMLLFRWKSCHRPWHTGLKTFGEIECLRPDKGQRRRKVTRKPKLTTTTTPTTTTMSATTTTTASQAATT